jgi:hypothetical protein
VVSRLILAVLPIALLASFAGAQDSKPVFSPAMFKAAMEDPKKFTIDESSIEVVKLSEEEAKKYKPSSQIGLPKPPTGKPGPGNPPTPPFPGSGGDDPLRTIDRIINIGKKIWDIIEKNKPVVDLKNDYASAVPEGIKHWTQLERWNPPKTTLYRLAAKNAYGVETVGVTFAVIRTWGGSYKGKGKFLHGVTVEPLKVDVLWGYTLNMNATIPSTVNVGTSEDPIAAMTVKLGWVIKTVIKESQGSGVYFVRGDGRFSDIGARSSLAKTTAGKSVTKKIKDLSVRSPF